MTYQLRRLDLLRSGAPVLIGLAVVGLAVGLVGFKIQKLLVMGIGAFVYALAIILLAKPVVSVLLALLGLGGGILTFFLLPNPEMMGQPVTTRLLATILFSVLYLALMETLLLIGAFIYNMLVQTLGLTGVHLELAAEEAPAEEAPGA